MDTRNTIEIKIQGRKYKLSGEESPAYMQKAADFVDSVYTELRTIPGFTSRSTDYQNLMMYLNMADKYLKTSGWDEEAQTVKDKARASEISSLQDEVERLRASFKEEQDALIAQRDDLKKRLETLSVERNRFADKDREASAKVSALEKEAASHRTEISILKRKVNDFIKSSVEYERTIRDQKLKLDKIAQDQTDTEQMRAESEQLQAVSDRLSVENEQLKKENEALKREVMELKGAAASESMESREEMEQQLNAMKLSYQRSLEEAWQDSENQLAELRAEYENRIATMKPGYENLLTEQENEFKEVKQALEASLEEVKKENALLSEQAVSLKASLEEVKKENDALAGQAASASCLEEVKKENALLSEQAENLRASLEEARKENAVLTEQAAASGEKTKEASSALISEKDAKIEALMQENSELADRLSSMENDMIEYLDLVEEKDREIARLRFNAEEGLYDE